MAFKYTSETAHEHGVECPKCHSGYYKMTDAARESIGKPCKFCPGQVWAEFERDVEVHHKIMICSRCESEDCREYHSLGIYAGTYCEKCWKASGYRDEGPEGFHPDDAGESYESDDY